MIRRVTIEPASRTIEVQPGESVLAAALRQGFGFPYSCRNGSCGACMGTLREGRIDYPHGTPAVLSAADQAAGRAIFCQAHPLSDLVIEASEITQTRAQVIRALPARVIAIEPLASDVRRLRLQLPPAERMNFLAGQYLDILLRDGRRRSFSLANAPDREGTLELHVRHCPGGRFTDYVFDGLRERSLLRVEGPLGTFFLRDSAHPLLMVAGGTGFAPLKAMLEQLLPGDDPRPAHLFWGARRQADIYLDRLVREWMTRYPGRLRYTPVLSDAAGDEAWKGERGWVHEAVLRAYPRLDGYDVYMSGPPAMINAARGGFVAAGLPAGQLFFDAFDYADDSSLE